MKDDQLKKFIQSIHLDEPAASFTDDTMKIIAAQEELELHPSLLPFIEPEVLSEPGDAFSGKVMASIQPAKNKTAAPIITRKFILILSCAAFLALLFAVILSPSNSNEARDSTYLLHVNTSLQEPTLELIKIAGTVLPYFIPFSILLLADYFFRTRREQLHFEE